jgi:hypothetical protein
MLLIAALAIASVMAQTSAPTVSPAPSVSAVAPPTKAPVAKATSTSSAPTVGILATGVLSALAAFAVLSL